jgi:hypothetical protein
MKKKGSYMSEADIPAEDKHLYKQVGGKWVFDTELFDEDEIENLVVPGLTSNKSKLKEEKTNSQTALREEKEKTQQLQAELDKIQKPGTKVLSKEEAEQFEEYQKLGPAKDIDAKLKKSEENEKRVKEIEAEKEDDKIISEAKVDKQAFNDFKKLHGEGLKFVTKEIEEQDPKNAKNKIKRTALMVQYDEKDGNTVKSREKELSEYAKEKNVSQYLVDAIFATEVKGQQPNNQQRKIGVHVPSLAANSSKKPEGTGGGSQGEKSYAQKANERRNGSRTMPWQKTENKES